MTSIIYLTIIGVVVLILSFLYVSFLNKRLMQLIRIDIDFALLYLKILKLEYRYLTLKKEGKLEDYSFYFRFENLNFKRNFLNLISDSVFILGKEVFGIVSVKDIMRINYYDQLKKSILCPPKEIFELERDYSNIMNDIIYYERTFLVLTAYIKKNRNVENYKRYYQNSKNLIGEKICAEIILTLHR